MRIVIGADHAGFGYKEILRQELAAMGHEVEDVGTHSDASVDYPDSARAVAEAVAQGRADRGIVLCGSGIGASIAANKVPGALAANVENAYAARQGVEHDAMNVLVMGARTLGIEVARDLMHAFLGAQFVEDERFIRRLNKVRQIETDYQKN
ncbi:MAG TPA: ribose-5-phosphate isomerase [Armatimonadetes bacterium]|jgi:RpiB/LacA/LacB family sugar-phosphate isomerase|nr:ribose-5-phosphate isomerase [Armatimonadota bacterium]HCM73655.1 ribose-5-phosphate isomerase [Armatimonadota bacterium]HRD30846.1 RpiB/LacA/LacB family sugar-phosphate isomerase [Fimbriimonadaceae bacterium]HRE94818.1 RpiB/LacA/LacB family sugar-phosphate isomerase [Fimbriimonadaceae bacterium]